MGKEAIQPVPATPLRRAETASSLIMRPRLLADLDRGSALTALVAPRGFGKTTLLRQWRAHRRESPVPDRTTEVWVRLSTSTDESEWWQTVLSAMARAGLRRPSSTPTDDDPRATAEQLLYAARTPVLLVIDGLDQCPDDAAKVVLDLLIDGAVARLVVSLRSHDHYLRTPLATYPPTLITAEDLRFTPAEIERLAGTPDPAADVDVAAAVDATGGWPAPTAAYVAELVRSRALPSARQRAGDAVTALVHDQLLDVGRERLDALASLLRAEEFDTALANELASGPVAEHIAWLTDTGLLRVEPGARPTYRWPDTVRTVLRSATVDIGRADIAQVHGAISRWYLQRDEPAPALRHATLAEDWPLIVDILEKHARTLLFAHAYQELYQALHRTPLDELARSPIALGLRDTWLRVPDDMLSAATALPGAADALAELGRSPHAPRTLEAGFVLLGALGRRGWIDHARVYGSRLLDVAEAARAAQPAEVGELYPSLHLHAGLLHLLGGDFTNGLRSLWRAYERAGDNPRVYIQSDAASKTALAYAVLGDQRRAAVWLDRHASAPLDAGYLEPRIRCTAIAARLLIAVDRLDAASADAAYSDILTADTNPEELFWAYLSYAEAQYALFAGAAGDMLDHLDRIRSHYEHWLGNGSVAGPLLAATSSDLLLALGRGNHARMIIDGPLADHPLLRVSKARLALLAGHTDAALRLATDTNWHRVAPSRHRIDMRLIHAVAAHRAGDHSTALVALGQAVDAAHLTGTLRPFVAVPADDLRSLAAELPAAAELLDSPVLKSARDLYPSRIDLVELTNREQQVLDRLAAGLSVQQIANSLRISYNTVKVQQRSLYRKLDVTSRDDAVARGREHGLVTSPPPAPQ